ncbi:hypothetical protein BAX94_01620 [Elizabethkingia meningoseptica]|uniref:GLPGLI family protein n=1 Tax=Elizabethkingia meningoseptica TaxID=238 RepID=A0A1V3TWS7_ELIME|nr:MULTISPECIES: GLPGLI family protein [Elizabethkingia]AQX12602.1 hypothetical protein BBD35_09555 [Elizabethkingia meningoseptica]MBG0514154.1 GLPGLI family protein [Elizabethkingia meningoseptica]MDE5433071.1 GLPGLI family protein [Elizabethkingia meningoseptica]MDE5450520.1 GLPGLI family protein [Elizabethkingia meningoseptica]MDE5471566.1 GLPGLI family protein [Elizabethkingia meningoseptica]
MKKVLLFISITIGSIILAQQLSGTITYQQYILSPVVKESKTVLLFNKEHSLYIDKTRGKENTSVKKMPDGSIVYPVNKEDSIANKPRFVYFNNNNKIFYNNIINNDIETILYDIHQANWRELSDHKTISGYKCQKATGEIHGKKYTVWFTSELPLNYGPLKINGLRGIILEVYDNEHTLSIKVQKIELSDTDQDIRIFMEKYDLSKSVSREQYDKILEAQLKDFEDKINQNRSDKNKFKFKKECDKGDQNQSKLKSLNL